MMILWEENNQKILTLYTIRIKPEYFIPTQRYFYHDQYKRWVELKYLSFKSEKRAEKFIDKHLNEIDWDDMSTNFTLSEKYVRKYFDYFRVNSLCKFYKFSEEFIREYRDCLDWANISQYQILNQNFIKEMKHYVLIPFLKDNWNINQYIVEKIFQ